jgi:hypothetical protein
MPTIHKKRKEKHKGHARPWEPNERDLDIYIRVNSGRSHARVAQKFGLTRVAISLICKKLDKWFADLYMGKIRELKAGHTQRLEYIYREAMSAWRRSQRDDVTETEKEIGHGQFPGTDRTEVRKGQVGASEFLQTAMKALNDIREIWGANAPLEIAHSGEVRVAGRPVDEARSELLEKVQRLTAATRN